MKDDNTKLSLKSSFKKIYTGEAIVPTVDDINFANLANIKDANNNVILLPLTLLSEVQKVIL